MRTKHNLTKLEFIMMVNDNIIVQRFFNVKDFNMNSRNSMELYEYLNEFVENLNYKLKMKSTVYLLENQYDIMNNPGMLETSYVDGPEYFNIYLKLGDAVLSKRTFDAKIYPPKIRYTVDIRKSIKEVLNDLTNILSSDNLSYDYLGYNTNV